ncbi:13210_t:CDS:2, partial [Cetraspora pellucida]
PLEQIQIEETKVRSESAIDYDDIGEFVYSSLVSLEGTNENYESDILEFYMNFDIHLENKESTKYEQLGHQIVQWNDEYPIIGIRNDEIQNIFNFQDTHMDIEKIPIDYNSVETYKNNFVLSSNDDKENSDEQVLNHLCNILEE